MLAFPTVLKLTTGGGEKGEEVGGGEEGEEVGGGEEGEEVGGEEEGTSHLAGEEELTALTTNPFVQPPDKRSLPRATQSMLGSAHTTGTTQSFELLNGWPTRSPRHGPHVFGGASGLKAHG